MSSKKSLHVSYKITTLILSFIEPLTLRLFLCTDSLRLAPKNCVTFFSKGGRGPNLFTDETGCCCFGLHRIAGAHVFLLPLEHTEQKVKKTI